MKVLQLNILCFALLVCAQVVQAQTQTFANKDGEYVIVEIANAGYSPVFQNYKTAMSDLRRHGYVEVSPFDLPAYIKDDVWCKVSGGGNGSYAIECYPAHTQGWGVSIKALANNAVELQQKLLTARDQQRRATKFLEKTVSDSRPPADEGEQYPQWESFPK